jgi:isochorismate pyruvate lyase
LRISQPLRCNIGSTGNACASKRAIMTSIDIEHAENCQTMEQVRRGVDITDAALIALLARRFAYMDAAARIKTDRSRVRDEARKQTVISNATGAAVDAGIPTDIIANMWEALVEGSIAYEMDAWDRLHG